MGGHEGGLGFHQFLSLFSILEGQQVGLSGGPMRGAIRGPWESGEAVSEAGPGCRGLLSGHLLQLFLALVAAVLFRVLESGFLAGIRSPVTRWHATTQAGATRGKGHSGERTPSGGGKNPIRGGKEPYRGGHRGPLVVG